jgi:hypothetical protein
MAGQLATGLTPLFFVITVGSALILFALAILLFRTARDVPRQARLLRGGSVACLALAGLFVALTLLELAFRILIPGGYLKTRPLRASDPLAQVEALDDGRAHWEFRGAKEFDEEGYRGGRPEDDGGAFRLGVLGDSVTYGVSVPHEENFVSTIARRLAERCGKVAVYDVSTPGYSVLQERISFERKLLPVHPDLLFLGLFSNDLAQFTVIGQTAYDIRVKEEGGVPVFDFLPLPDRLNAALLAHSVFYQFVTLRSMAAADRAAGRQEAALHDALADLERIRAACETAGIPLVVALFPDLDTPLNEPESRGTALFYDPVREWAAGHSVPLIDVRPLLADQPVEAIRLDECCHYNERGHAAVAAALFPEIDRLGLLARKCPTSSSASPRR